MPNEPVAAPAASAFAFVIDDATSDDVRAINDVANIDIERTTVTWSDHPRAYESRMEWFEAQQHAANPVLVARSSMDRGFLGYATYGDFRDSTKWNGYRFVAEHTIHVVPAAHGRGVGAALMRALEARAAEAGKHVLVGAIDGANVSSIEFHRRLGYEEVGRLPEIGWKLGQWLELVLMQKTLDPGATR